MKILNGWSGLSPSSRSLPVMMERLVGMNSRWLLASKRYALTNFSRMGLPTLISGTGQFQNELLLGDIFTDF